LTVATKKTKKAPTKKAPTKRTAKPKAAPAPEAPRTIPCKICKARIEFTTGLDEMAKHWEDEHPDALDRLRRKIDDRSRFPRE
jgi:hypothetical protein